MANYTTTITNEGAALLASVIANQGTLTFNEFRFSENDYTGQESTLTEVTFLGVFITAGAAASVIDLTTIKASAQFDNSTITGNHDLYSIGIIGTDGNTTALIAVCTTTDPDVIREPLTGTSTYAFNVNLSVSDTSQITVVGTTAAVIYDIDVVDNLISPATNKPLSASQGRVLKGNIDDNFSGQSNENLLDNPWFTVNQRGATTIAGGYGADRWKCLGGTSLTFSVGQVTITNSLCAQPFENHIPNGTYTASAELSDGNIYYGTATKVNDTDEIEFFNNNTFRLVYNYGGSGSKLFTIDNANVGTGTITVKHVKLEPGTVSTLANDVAPNYTTELLKCQRYFKVALNDTWNVGIGIAMATDTIEFYYFSDIPMRVAPSVSTVGSITAVKIADGSEVAISSVEGSFDINAKNGRINFKTSTTLTIRDLYILRMNNAKVMLSADL